MKREEVPHLTARLIELADYYGVKAPSTAAARIWIDCLEGVNWHDVAAVLTDWPKHQKFFPTGQEVRKAASTLLSDRLEAESKRNAALAPTIESILAVAADGPNARAFKRMWTAWKTRKVSSPREWCNNVLVSDKATPELKHFASHSVAWMGDEKPRRGRYWFQEEDEECR